MKWNLFFFRFFGLTFLLSIPVASTQALIINDFSQLNETEVAQIYHPTSVVEIQQIIKKAQRQGKTVSVSGKRHSQGGHAFLRDGIVIDMNHFNKILRLDAARKILTVQTGATWEQIQEYINPYHLAIKVMQTTQIFTVGGSLSVNAHGRDPQYGPLIETVKAIRILLASGEIVQASRTQHYELFKLAIGGYGLFGVILEVDIELTDNPVYKKRAHVIKVKDYAPYLRSTVIGNKELGLHYGIVSLAPYSCCKKMVVANYTKLPAGSTIPVSAYQLKKESWINFQRKGLGLRRKSRFFDTCSSYTEWPFIIMREKLPHITCRNNAMRHPVQCLEHEAAFNTDVLQSYFVPLHAFENFMNYLRVHVWDGSLRVMYALTRFIPHNTESFLHYTNNDYIEVVLFVCQGTTAQEIDHAQRWTRAVVEKVLSYGGCYYLPVRLYPTSKQLKQAYFMIDTFFAKKCIYDPNELFVNMFYAHYKDSATML